MTHCYICFEKKENFTSCPQSDKHQWCLDCSTRMLNLSYDRCPFCRTELTVQSVEFNYWDLALINQLVPDNQNIQDFDHTAFPNLQRQSAEYFVFQNILQ